MWPSWPSFGGYPFRVVFLTPFCLQNPPGAFPKSRVGVTGTTPLAYWENTTFGHKPSQNTRENLIRATWRPQGPLGKGDY